MIFQILVIETLKVKAKKDLFKEANDDNDITNSIENYLETQYEDMEFNDAIRKDHRTFCECY